MREFKPLMRLQFHSVFIVMEYGSCMANVIGFLVRQPGGVEVAEFVVARGGADEECPAG